MQAFIYTSCYTTSQCLFGQYPYTLYYFEVALFRVVMLKFSIVKNIYFVLFIFITLQFGVSVNKKRKKILLLFSKDALN